MPSLSVLLGANPDGEFYEIREMLLDDFDGDNVVGFDDFVILSSNFGLVDSFWAEGDLDGDGEVTFADFCFIQGISAWCSMGKASFAFAILSLDYWSRVCGRVVVKRHHRIDSQWNQVCHNQQS